jgi:hypothetical protein
MVIARTVKLEVPMKIMSSIGRLNSYSVTIDNIDNGVINTIIGAGFLKLDIYFLPSAFALPIVEPSYH